MIIFPILALLISLSCAVAVGRDAVRSPRPHLVIWTISFAIFALAAAAQVIGSLAGWTPFLVHLYYLAGAVLVVGFLALGEAALLWPGVVGRFVPGIALLLTAVAATVVFEAPVDTVAMQTVGWQAIQRGPVLVALAIGVNSLGTLVLVVGALWSAWVFWRRGMFRERMLGCLLIAGGTLTVAAGGTLTRLGNPQLLYVAMALGVGLIFLGYRMTRAKTVVRAVETPPLGRVVSLSSGDVSAASLQLITYWLTTLDPETLAVRCQQWSAKLDDRPNLTREEAQRLWALRLDLSPEAQQHLDALPMPTQRMLVELRDAVFVRHESSDRAVG